MSNTVIIEETLLSGKLEPEAEIEGKIFSEFELKGELALPVGYRDYDGPYNVIPKVISQELDTADKHLSKDVTVEAIPYYEVSNPTGKTIIIGGN